MISTVSAATSFTTRNIADPRIKSAFPRNAFAPARPLVNVDVFADVSDRDETPDATVLGASAVCNAVTNLTVDEAVKETGGPETAVAEIATDVPERIWLFDGTVKDRFRISTLPARPRPPARRTPALAQ